MIFARFMGTAGEGNFIDSGIYLASWELDSGTVSSDLVEIWDEDGKKIREDTREERFEYLEEVCAVITVPFCDFDVGEVVVLEDARINGGIMYGVAGVGFIHANQLTILDGTILRPGTLVANGISGRSVKITKVDENGRIAVENSDRLKEPSEFQFFVENGEVLLAYWVECLDVSGEPNLTKGKLYRVTLLDKTNSVIGVINDANEEQQYIKDRFQSV